MDLIRKYFPDLDAGQLQAFSGLLELLPELNQSVNVISRKDVDSLEERHILHSLAIGKVFAFNRYTRVIDVGTGGGFPGIPLAILFPESSFTLVDSIGKKILLVEELIKELDIKNVKARKARMEEVNLKADFVVSRAVTAFPKLEEWTRKLIVPGKRINLANGLISLKGGSLEVELAPYGKKVRQYPLKELFEEEFFSTKKIVYLKK